MKYAVFLLQISLCVILAISFSVIKSRENLNYQAVGSFGTKAVQNNTLEDLCKNLYEDMFYE